MSDYSNIGIVGKPRNSVGEVYSFISSTGFSPKTVIDVGVGYGTPELYAAFPDSKLVLVEPLPEFEESIKNILSHRNGEYLISAAGNQNGTVTFNKHLDSLDCSSVLKEQTGPETDGEEVNVPVIRLEDYILTRNFEPPYLLKVDVQGAELDVIEGATGILNDCEVIVLEVSLFEFLKESPQFHEVILFMHKKGFVAYDIVPAITRPLDGALAQVDIAFVKENGMFRTDHRYKYPHQTQIIFQ